MKPINRKEDLIKECGAHHAFLDESIEISNFIDPSVVKIINNSISIYESLQHKEKNSIKIKYFHDRIEDYKSYLDFLGGVRNKIAPNTPLAFYTSTTNLINRGNYSLRIKFISDIIDVRTNPLFVFLEEPIFHSKKDFKITILKEKLVLDFKGNNFFEIKNNISYWEKKTRRDIGSYIEISQIKDKDWLKDRCFAVFDFLFRSILESNSYEEAAQKIAIDCLLIKNFTGIISSQSTLINLIKNKVDFQTLFGNENIEIDIIKCATCGKSHKGPISIKKPLCDVLNLQTIIDSKIRFKKALLPFISLSYLNIIPTLSNFDYLKNIDKFKPKNETNNSTVFLLNRIKFKSLFGESMSSINLLAEGITDNLYEHIKKWDNEKDIFIDNQSFYKVKGKQTNFTNIKEIEISEDIRGNIKKMEELRSLKNWQEADALRMKLIYLGIDVMEVKGETLIREIS